MKVTQCDRIRRHLDAYGSITGAEAMKEYGIQRLAARISDLKKEGVTIYSKSETSKNRYGESVSYKRYYICQKSNG